MVTRPARFAAILAVLASAIVVVAAFLPSVTAERAEFTFRQVDVRETVSQWSLDLLVVLTHATLVLGAGVSLLTGRGGGLGAGVLVALGTYGTVAALVGIVRPNEDFDPAVGLWLQLLAAVLVLVAALFAIRAVPRPADGRGAATPIDEPSAPPPGETLTG